LVVFISPLTKNVERLLQGGVEVGVVDLTPTYL
jgi:putative N-acetylmannosamine-6-phosphate epimerase